MKKKNEGFTNFLDKKYIPLQPKAKLLILVLMFVIPVVAFYFAFLKSNLATQQSLKNSKTNL